MKVWEYKSGNNDKLSKKLEKDPTITYTSNEMSKYLISLVHFKDGDRE